MYKIRSAELETVCGKTSPLPENGRPEAAFAGRSNAGKSSLINALLARKSIARVSSEPGKTRTINFYHVNRGVTEEMRAERSFAPDVYLVDLPGYGYASVSESERAGWGPMIERYLRHSRQLRILFLLVDIRRKPAGDDLLMYDFIVREGFQPVIIATKKDKIKKSEEKADIERIRSAFSASPGTPVIAFSSVTKEGLDEIWACILRAL